MRTISPKFKWLKCDFVAICVRLESKFQSPKYVCLKPDICWLIVTLADSPVPVVHRVHLEIKKWQACSKTISNWIPNQEMKCPLEFFKVFIFETTLDGNLERILFLGLLLINSFYPQNEFNYIWDKSVIFSTSFHTTSFILAKGPQPY